jgi:hypothetical protein
MNVDIDRPRDLRIAAGVMIGAAAAWPLLPVHPPFVCPLRTMTGIPCPFCGMTRAVVAAVHGDIFGSLRYNPLGIFIALLAIAIILRPQLLRIRPPIWLLVAGFAGLWAYNIALNPTFS